MAKINMFQLALRAALKRSDCAMDRRTFFVGAVGIRHDVAIVHARNEATEEPKPSAHAEARLCRKLGMNAPVVYVARFSFGKNGMALARPCITCMTALKNKKVSRVYFSTNSPHTDTWDYLDLG